MGTRFSEPVQTGPGAHSTSCTMGTGSFPEVKSGRGMTLTPHPLLVPWSRKSRAIPIHSLWAVLTVQGPRAHPASCTMGTGSFPGIKSGRGVTMTPHPLLVPWSRKSRAIPILLLWAVRPVQNLSSCTRVHFTLPFFFHIQLSFVAI